MLTPKEKTKFIDEFKINPADTGSAEVQIALLSEQIRKLLLHLKKFPKDFSSKRGLLRQVARRRTLLAYLKEESPRQYNAFIKKSGLSRSAGSRVARNK